jgi:hypothetical protein
MYLRNAPTFEEYLNSYNSYIMQYIHASEIDSITSLIQHKCVFQYCKDEGSIKQYYNDMLVSISTNTSYTLVKTTYPHYVDYIYKPHSIHYFDRFNNTHVIRLEFKEPVTETGKIKIVTKTYIADNLRHTSMSWDISGNLLTPSLPCRWKHSIINLKYVNSWIKANMQELIDMRNNHKKLNNGTSYSGRKVVAYSVDIDNYLKNTASNDSLERLINATNLKKDVAAYLASIQDDNAYIHTYFDTYEELEQYKSSRLRKDE